jgi:hypothetical protein
MDSSKLNDWLQVTGLFGVMGSLLFVGLQLKQEQEIARSVASQARTEANVQFLIESAANPLVASGLEKVSTGNESQVTYAERRAITMTNAAILFIYENIHFQYENGFIPEERWQATRRTIQGTLFNVPTLRSQFASNREQWSQSFGTVVDEIIAEIDAEALR